MNIVVIFMIHSMIYMTGYTSFCWLEKLVGPTYWQVLTLMVFLVGCQIRVFLLFVLRYNTCISVHYYYVGCCWEKWQVILTFAIAKTIISFEHFWKYSVNDLRYCTNWSLCFLSPYAKDKKPFDNCLCWDAIKLFWPILIWNYFLVMTSSE